MAHFSYIHYSEFRDRYYIGSSSCPEERLGRHSAGATRSTKSGRPWRIVYIPSHISRSDAFIHESYLKKMKSRAYLEDLILKSQER